MRRLLLALTWLLLLSGGVLAQGAPASSNLFWATPLSGTGYLTLRAIGVADLSGAAGTIAADTLLGNPTGSTAAMQPITVVSPLAFSGTTLTCSGCGGGGGSGTVTSVAMTVPSIMAVSGSPITGAGTLAVTLASETANTVLAAPNGSTGTPTFRTLVTADIPTIPFSDITSVAGNVTNADLANSGATVNGTLCTLGSTCTISTTTWPLAGDTTSATSAPVGDVGEVIKASNSAVAIATNTATTVTSMSVTAGHWSCQAFVSSAPAGTTTQSKDYISVSTTGNTRGAEAAETGFSAAITAGLSVRIGSPTVQYDSTSTATLYAVALIQYATSTLTADGALSCRRVW